MRDSPRSRNRDPPSHARPLTRAVHKRPPPPSLVALAQVWVGAGDIILVSLRDYQDEKGDVILKYTADEARQLKSVGELPGACRDWGGGG